jgi:diguanylate cyclase (GGDEF)-like protein
MSRIGLTRALLLAFLVAGGAPVLVFWLWPHNASVEREVNAVRERHLMLARTAADAVDRQMDMVARAFAAVAPMVAAGEEPAFGERLLDELDFRHVCVAERGTGRVVRGYMAQQAACPETIPPERLAMFEELAAEPGPMLSPVTTMAGEPLLYLAQGAGDLLVVGAVRTGFFRQIAGGIVFGERGHATLVDRRGRVLSHPREDWTRAARELGEIEPVRRLLAGESGVAAFRSPAMGVDMIAGFAAAPRSGIGVIVSQPLSELSAPARATAFIGLGVFAAGLMLSAAIALAFSAHLAHGVRRVADAASAMGRGESGVRVPATVAAHALSEVATLGRAFNVMAQRVEAAHARILAVSRTDALTGLANRSGFIEAADALLREGVASGRAYALFFLDVDHFKAINDSYGHAVGDAVLREVAARLRRVAGPDDLIGRQGGDEFLILRAQSSPRDGALVGARLARALRRPIRVGEQSLTVAVSIGVASAPRDARDVDGLVLHADQAMYEAKRGGRGFMRVFDAEVRRRIEESVALKRELREAVAGGGVTAEFQPILRTRDGELVGFEALARWVSPTIGPVPAERFIAAAEDGGVISELGTAVRREAIAFAAALRRSGLTLPVAVNVSPIELVQSDFARRLSAELHAFGLPPSALTVELTERLFRDAGPREIAALFDLRRRGMGFALDDFGEGYSSHSQLRTYPVDRMKISGAFIADAEHDARTRAMVRSMIDLGRSLGMTVTVEGVETPAQRTLVEALGAEEFQGFLEHRPMDATAALAMAQAVVAPMRRAVG